MLLRDLVAITRDEIAWLRLRRRLLYSVRRAVLLALYRPRPARQDAPPPASTPIANSRTPSRATTHLLPASIAPGLDKRRSRSRSTFAVGIAAARGLPKAATTPSPKNCSTCWTWIPSCSNMTIERSGGFEPLRLVPRGKSVVLGLVTTKNPALESQDALRRRIDEAAHVPCLSNASRSARNAALPQRRQAISHHRSAMAQTRAGRGYGAQSLGLSTASRVPASPSWQSL